jgi:hypothetical protein
VPSTLTVRRTENQPTLTVLAIREGVKGHRWRRIVGAVLLECRWVANTGNAAADEAGLLSQAPTGYSMEGIAIERSCA